MSEFEEKLKTIEENIEWLIAEHPECKDDYRLLSHYYHFYIDGLKNFVPLEKLRSLTQPESINRIFRDIVHKQRRKEAQPSEIVQESRAIQQEQFHEHFSKQKRREEQWV